MYSTPVHARIPNGHPRDDPRAEVVEDVRVGVRVRVGAVECKLNCVTLTADFLIYAERLSCSLLCMSSKFGTDNTSRFSFRARTHAQTH